jgi:hypothetical protein
MKTNMTPPAAKNAPPRPGFQGSENVDAVPSPRFQTLEETGAKNSKGWKTVRHGFPKNRCEVFAA